MQINSSDLQTKIDTVKADMLSRFPDCRHTIGILLWDDGTDSVECRHGDAEGVVHTSTSYNGELIRESTEAMQDGVFMVKDKVGKYIYVYPALVTEEEMKELIKEGKEIPLVE